MATILNEAIHKTDELAWQNPKRSRCRVSMCGCTPSKTTLAYLYLLKTVRNKVTECISSDMQRATAFLFGEPQLGKTDETHRRNYLRILARNVDANVEEVL